MSQLSVIVPSYNSQSFIACCLKAIRDSTYKDYTLIVIDCGSKDDSVSIAKQFSDIVVELSNNPNRNFARRKGLEISKSPIIVNIDSDVIISSDTLLKIHNYFSQHPEIDALTGMLSKNHPNGNFYSQYKNLYMYYHFINLPEKITFLYGSIYAIRKEATTSFFCNSILADDTALGQNLFISGKKMAFLKELEVIHLKKYSLLSLVKNDFRIPFDWAKIFLYFKGWKQLGKNKTGFAHASMAQIISILLSFIIVSFFIFNIFFSSFFSILIFTLLIWILLNVNFLLFLFQEKGVIFTTLAFFFTFFDNIIMGLGIFSGFIDFYRKIDKVQKLN
ncbi:MAG: glycosyltransferase family 2 protein [Candidatus Omnitrophica bacterium]|jgi:glycosyltransferase involved in cell wall biosynthesis|nr:glycosyltransferase family 2 protein [Candidatus Omnitrophota bacterium]